MTKFAMEHFKQFKSVPKNRLKFKKFALIILFICCMSYILIDFNLKTGIMHFRRHFDFMNAHFDAKNLKPRAYFVDTSGCRMPYFNVSDNQTRRYIYKQGTLNCKKPLTRVSLENATLWLNMNDAEILKRYNVTNITQENCFYSEIKRKIDREQNEYMEKIDFILQRNTPITIPASFEFIYVACARANGEVFYKDFHFFALDKSTEKSAKFNHKMPNTQNLNSTSHSFPSSVSVMVLGVDSVSHLNFLRQMKQTSRYIREHLAHVEFWGYNKIDDNTYPNLMPALTGRNESELDILCRLPFKNTTYDNCTFLWQHFKEAGYQTAYAEDVWHMSLFNYLRPGFKKQPTDYYMHPIVKEMEKHIRYKRNNDLHWCAGGRRSVDVVFEMMHRLIPLFQRQLFFSFFWTVTFTHDYLNMPQLLDADLVKLFANFVDKGIMNNTVIFLMSDHGMRFGAFRKTYQGMMEDRQPLLIALYPQWMRQRYPKAIANLAQNSKRLTTHFDLYNTMLDLVDLHNLDAEKIAARAAELQQAQPMPRGISLFLPIPQTRSCELAGIASHWCTCHQKKELPTNDINVRHAANYTIQLINAKLRNHPQCQILYLNSILNAIAAATHTDILNKVSNYDYGIDITVRVQTKPGLGEFESTVRISNHSKFHIGAISRVNIYGKQSYCIDDYLLKMFCYCR